ncbi:phytanoyl-CoA dioxygenase family protein [Comamonas serinivorans]|nr:phytanoyl-CoA dioxygenase family protein [Comamonas serinivorans]
MKNLFKSLFFPAPKPQASASGGSGRPKAREEAGAEFYSDFGGLWIDRRDALAVLDRKAAEDPDVAVLRPQIEQFIRDGYVVLEQAVSHELIDAYTAELQRHIASGISPLQVSVPVQGPQDKSVVSLADADVKAPLSKILDTYACMPSALPMVFNEAVHKFLRAVFEEEVLAFQGLHFERGSTQAIHQDTAYVVADRPLEICASWLALEDIQPGSGELIYYVGSHHALADWKYSGRFKHYNHERDPHAEHMGHLNSLVERSEAQGLELAHFLPKKGDVLIWSADLAHGGSQILNPDVTRRSLVTHFSPQSATPNYFRYLPKDKQVYRTYQPGCHTATMYY